MATNNRQFAQRARRDYEREQRPERDYPPTYYHGEVVGAVTFELHGRVVKAELLATGKHCRSFGVRIDGKVIGVMGMWGASLEVSKRMARPISDRHFA